jgi:hypothetical protein
MSRLFFFLLFLCAYLFASAEILYVDQPDTLAELLLDAKRVDEKTLLVWDIDDTLIVSNEVELRGENFNHLIADVAKEANLSMREAFYLIESALQNKAKPLGSGRQISPKIYECYLACKKRLIKMIALTHVASGYHRVQVPRFGIDYLQTLTGEERRVADLFAAGFSFEDSFGALFEDQTISILSCAGGQDGKAPRFKQGVIVTNLLPKGDVLQGFLDMIPWSPQRVVFVDNQMHHVRSVVEKMEERGIDVLGIHFDFVTRSLLGSSQKTTEALVRHLVKQQQWLPQDQ